MLSTNKTTAKFINLMIAVEDYLQFIRQFYEQLRRSS